MKVQIGSVMVIGTIGLLGIILIILLICLLLGGGWGYGRRW